MPRVLILIALPLLSACAQAVENLAVLSPREGGPSPDTMVYAYLSGHAHEALDRRRAAYESIKTAEALTAYQDRLKAFFREQVGEFPDRTPLNARVTGSLDRDGYRIEKVVFESRPGILVTGLLYLPLGEPPHPAVLVPCGHSTNGKAAEAYQRGSILLAMNGVAAFCFDPLGQGERFVIPGTRHGATTQHTLVGVGRILLGGNVAGDMIWDGMRAIDYLCERPDIDPERIGCAGNSGGGTQTSYFMALDERIAVAAPACYLTSFERLIDTIGPQDAEQNIFGQIAFGMNHADYILMRAPKPTLMCVATQDYFDIDGAWDSYRQAKRMYTRIGHSERVGLVETDEKHGWTTELRVGTMRWMRRWFLNSDEPRTEPDFPILTDEEALCTPEGQVLALEGARSHFELNADHDAQLADARRALWEADRAAALDRVRALAGIRPLSGIPDPQVEEAGVVDRDGYRIVKRIIRPEPGIALPALAFVPGTVSAAPCLYLHDEGKHVDAAPGGPIEALMREGRLVLAVDVRGIGETRSAAQRGGFADLFGGDWKDYYLAYGLGRSILGMRAEDILACARLLRGASGGPIDLVARGQLGPPALHALALEPQLFAAARLERSIESWADVIRAPEARNQLVNTVHGALTAYDLPDLAATLPDGVLSKIAPVDPLGNPLNEG